MERKTWRNPCPHRPALAVVGCVATLHAEMSCALLHDHLLQSHWEALLMMVNKHLFEFSVDLQFKRQALDRPSWNCCSSKLIAAGLMALPHHLACSVPTTRQTSRQQGSTIVSGLRNNCSDAVCPRYNTTHKTLPRTCKRPLLGRVIEHGSL